MKGYSYTPEYRREYVEAHRDRIRANGRASYAKRNNKKKLARLAELRVNGGAESERLKHVRDPRLRMIVCAKHRAKKRGLMFSITLMDLGPLPTVCPVLGIKITVFGGRDNRPEIDRLIPSLGYVPGNVAIISARANRIKNDGTLDDLIKITHWLQSRLGVI